MSDLQRDDRTIFIFNARDDMRYAVMKEFFKLSDDDVYNTVNSEFDLLLNALRKKGINYDDLKSALLPNQDEGKSEICFVIDREQLCRNDYGSYVFSELLPLLDKKSVYSVLCGDYVDFLAKNDGNSQFTLWQAMRKVIKKCNKSTYVHSSQYYLIYFNRLTRVQFLNIVEKLIKYPWFTGYADVTHLSNFKTFLSCILTNTFIKCKDVVIMPHPEDCADGENVNTYGYDFEKNGFKTVSINRDLFGTFLSYKIEAHVPDENDVSFSFNALFPKFESIDSLQLKVEDKKWSEYLVSDGGKGGLFKLLGFSGSDKDKFIREIFKKICSGYIYKLESKQYGDKRIWKFCVCIDMQTVNGSLRKTTAVLNYFPDKGEMHVITVT